MNRMMSDPEWCILRSIDLSLLDSLLEMNEMGMFCAEWSNSGKG